MVKVEEQMYEKIYQLLQPIKQRESVLNRKKFKNMFCILFYVLLLQTFPLFAKDYIVKLAYEISIWLVGLFGILWIIYWILIPIKKTRFLYGLLVLLSILDIFYVLFVYTITYIMQERKSLAVRMTVGVILTIMGFVILLQVIMVIYKIKAGHYAFGKINVKIYIPVTFIGAVVASLVPLTFFGFRKNAGNILGKDWAMVYVIYAFAVLFAVSSRYLIHLIIYQFANFKLTDEEYEKLGSPKENRRHFELQEKAKEEARKKKQMEDVKEETNDEYEN